MMWRTVRRGRCTANFAILTFALCQSPLTQLSGDIRILPFRRGARAFEWRAYLTGITIGWPFSATRKSIARARSVVLGFLMR
jgi:hypothetical protein